MKTIYLPLTTEPDLIYARNKIMAFVGSSAPEPNSSFIHAERFWNQPCQAAEPFSAPAAVSPPPKKFAPENAPAARRDAAPAIKVWPIPDAMPPTGSFSARSFAFASHLR